MCWTFSFSASKVIHCWVYHTEEKRVHQFRASSLTDTWQAHTGEWNCWNFKTHMGKDVKPVLQPSRSKINGVDDEWHFLSAQYITARDFHSTPCATPWSLYSKYQLPAWQGASRVFSWLHLHHLLRGCPVEHVLPVVSNPEANAFMHVCAHTGVSLAHHSHTNNEHSRFVQKGKAIYNQFFFLNLCTFKKFTKCESFKLRCVKMFKSSVKLTWMCLFCFCFF